MLFSYWIYEYTDKLREIQYKFAKKLGIPVNESSKSDLISILNFQGHSTGDFSSRYIMPPSKLPLTLNKII